MKKTGKGQLLLIVVTLINMLRGPVICLYLYSPWQWYDTIRNATLFNSPISVFFRNFCQQSNCYLLGPIWIRQFWRRTAGGSYTIGDGTNCLRNVQLKRAGRACTLYFEPFALIPFNLNNENAVVKMSEEG